MGYNVSGLTFGMYGIEVSSVDEICALLGFDAAYNVNSIPTFRDIVYIWKGPEVIRCFCRFFAFLLIFLGHIVKVAEIHDVMSLW